MNSQFMDKQITGLSAAGSESGDGELFDLKKEEILPSYDFQPIRTVGSSSSMAVNNGNGKNLDAVAKRSWGSADSNIGSASLRYSNILEPHEPPKNSHEKERDAYDVATLTEIDRTVKKYADNLLHTLEGVSSRLVQLESRTRHLENSIDELKDTIGNNSGSTDGKMRHLENILREVQTGVQVLRDKQEIADAELQLAKRQQTSSTTERYHPPPESSDATAPQPDSLNHPQPPPPLPPHQPSYLPAAPVPRPPPQQQPPPPPTLPTPNAPPPTQFSQPQLSSVQSLPLEPSYFPQPGAPQMQPQPQSQPPPPQPQHYQLPQYSQQMPPPQSLHPEETAPYMPPPPPPPSQTYPPSIRQPTSLSQPPPSTVPPQYRGPGQPPPYPSNYGPTDGGYPFNSGYPSHYSSSTMKQSSPFANSPPLTSGGGGGGNYHSRLPTAKILPHAVPAGQSSGGGSGRAPIDDVVDKVVTMGFSREQVRATVRKLTENGQSVDLNAVLDKLMNDARGEMIQPQKGWFGR